MREPQVLKVMVIQKLSERYNLESIHISIFQTHLSCGLVGCRNPEPIVEAMGAARGISQHGVLTHRRQSRMLSPKGL